MADPNNPFGYNQAYVPKKATGIYDTDMTVSPDARASQPGGGYGQMYESAAPPVPSKVGLATTLMSGATGVAMGAGLLTGGTGWLIMGGIQLLGGLLGAFTKQKPYRTPQEEEYENMVSFYRDIGARTKAARAVVSVATGKPVASLGHIGVDDNTALDMTRNHFDTVRTTAATKVTRGTR